MPKRKKKQATDSTDFSAVTERFRKRVLALGDPNDEAAAEAYRELGSKLYSYAETITRRDAVSALGAYVARRDRSAAKLEMNVFQLVVELVMLGKFPPLGSTLRRHLAFELTFAKHRHVEPNELTVFLKRLPPRKVMKEELGLITKVPGSPGWARRSAPGPSRLLPRNPKPHRLANSASDKLRKQGAKMTAKEQSINTAD